MKKILIVLIPVILLAASLYYWRFAKKSEPAETLWGGSSANEAVSAIGELNPENSIEYKDEERKFTFRYPSDMNVAQIPSETGQVLLVQQAEKGLGFQIAISAFDEEGSVLSEERIKQDIPELKIDEAQPVQIGESGEGLAFISDNENFGGRSREVWFIYKGSLYQISTYANLDKLLKSVFATWKFY